MKKIMKWIGILLGCILLLAAGLVGYLTATDYRPREVSDAMCFISEQAEAIDISQPFTVLSWNTGYGGLGRESDFFMDGGKMVAPPSQEAVTDNIRQIRNFLGEAQADAYFLQEVDLNSSRSGGVNQFDYYGEALPASSAFAYNYKCGFVPFPLPPIGRVESGVATFTSKLVKTVPQRISLPSPFSWPVSTANLKRCLLVTRLPIEGSDREVVLVNLHLEAYDNGEGKRQQTEMLLSLLEQEYAQGNYVIAGGDFNQTFPGMLEAYPVQNEEFWTPGLLSGAELPAGWQYACDGSAASCRLLNKPYESGNQQLYVIDGFLLSPNVQVTSAKTIDLEFQHADHNPVSLTVTFQ